MENHKIDSIIIISSKQEFLEKTPVFTFGMILSIILSFSIPFLASGKTRERLVFDLKFGIIKGGEAVMTIKDTTFNGNKAVDFHLKGRTTGMTDRIFKIDDIYESTVDAQTYLPYRALRNIRERKYRYYNEAFFFQDNDSLYSQRTGGIRVPHQLSDILSVFFYFVKTNMITEIDDGKNVVIPTLHGHEIQNVKIRFCGMDTLETKMGKVESYVLSPEVEKGKVLKRSDGLRFYFSKETKIPIQLDFETKVGTLRAILVSYRINGVEQIKSK
jgi:hypothetical protein